MAYPVRKIILVLIALSAPAVGLTIQEKQPSKPCPALDLIVDPSTDVHAQETFKFATAAMLLDRRKAAFDHGTRRFSKVLRRLRLGCARRGNGRYG
jgi:hypothetical protein